MKKYLQAIPALAILALIVSCGPNENLKAYEEKLKKSQDSVDKAKAVVTPITWAQVTKENQYKKVSLSGYLHLPSTMYTSGKNMQAYLYERPNQTGGFHIILSIVEGTGNNTAAKLGDKYKTEDFKIKTDKGELIAGEGAYVTITGELLSVYPDDYASMSTATKIEKAEPVAVDLDALNPELVTKDNVASLNHKMVKLKAKLSAGYILNSSNSGDAYMLSGDGADIGGDGHFIAYVKIGNGNSQMAEINGEWSDKDIKIKDDKGKAVPQNKMVTLYGVLEKGSGSTSLHVEKIVQ